MLPPQWHTLVCCAPVHRISLLKETGDLGVSGDSLLVQVVFPRVLGVRVIQRRSVQKGVFPLAHVSSFFTLICGGCGAVLSPLCARVLPSGLIAVSQHLFASL